jgi:broad specificity phosphatase PhoE
MRITLIRHGRMTGDPHRRYLPPVDGCLSPEGVAQAEALGHALAGRRFTHVFSSPLGRAIQTAQVLPRAPGTAIQVLDWLEEWRPAPRPDGQREAARHEEMCTRAAQLPPEQTWKTAAGEGTLEMAARIVPGWIALMERLGAPARFGGYQLVDPADASEVALVAHGGSLGHLLSFALGVPIRPNPPVTFAETGAAALRLVRQGEVWYPQLEIAPP